MFVSFLIASRLARARSQPSYQTRPAAAAGSSACLRLLTTLCSCSPCRPEIESTRLACGVGSGGHYETRFLRNHFGPGFADHARARRDGRVKAPRLKQELQSSQLAGGRHAESDTVASG